MVTGMVYPIFKYVLISNTISIFEDVMPRRSQLIIISTLSVIIAGVIIYLFFFQNKKTAWLPAALALPESTIAIYQGAQLEKSFASLQQTDIYRFLLNNESAKN